MINIMINQKIMVA